MLGWVDEMYEVKIEDEGRGIKKRNGAVARANAEGLSLLLYQLLEQGSWEAVRVGSTHGQGRPSAIGGPDPRPPVHPVCHLWEPSQMPLKSAACKPCV